MPEIKHEVKTVEINYVCDEFGYGMMRQVTPSSEETGEIPHKRAICGHSQTFKDVSYPHIAYLDIEDP
jgi:hypothetical protein